MPIAAPTLEDDTLRLVGLPNPLPVLDRAEVSFERTARPDQDARRPGQARRILAACMGVWRLRGYVDDAELLLSELVTNAFRHGTGDAVRVRFFLTEAYVCFEVRSGCADAAQAKAGPSLDEGGRGLFLVSRIAADWAVSSDHAGVWCTLPIVRAENAT
ncbi:ATP-binding protein [Streptomyces sp. NPDC046685]|uniref:ATP-binding protein n=1 Tax=Streptomyces sp. NPDC046685 TaxID=3157202 RepID=UPI00340B040E